MRPKTARPASTAAAPATASTARAHEIAQAATRAQGVCEDVRGLGDGGRDQGEGDGGQGAGPVADAVQVSCLAVELAAAFFYQEGEVCLLMVVEVAGVRGWVGECGQDAAAGCSRLTQ
jgi:hypothetical protein